ncbi:MAG TPA: hypothetical protein VLD39_12695 [Gammaproteobacteria bacterium]|nr:hypothetical protein [Gammaproteobacteria bacterium]
MNQQSKSRRFEVLLIVSLVLLTSTLAGSLVNAVLQSRVLA